VSQTPCRKQAQNLRVSTVRCKLIVRHSPASNVKQSVQQNLHIFNVNILKITSQISYTNNKKQDTFFCLYPWNLCTVPQQRQWIKQYQCHLANLNYFNSSW
jgi:hypothetical protein